MNGDLPIAIKILLLPVKAVLYVVKHPKLLIFVVIFIIGFTVYNQVASGDKESEVQIPEYQEDLPPVAVAPRIVQTESRYYPYATFYEDSQYLVLTDYYVYDKDTWRHETKPLPVEKTRIIKTYTR